MIAFSECEKLPFVYSSLACPCSVGFSPLTEYIITCTLTTFDYRKIFKSSHTVKIVSHSANCSYSSKEPISVGGCGSASVALLCSYVKSCSLNMKQHLFFVISYTQNSIFVATATVWPTERWELWNFGHWQEV